MITVYDIQNKDFAKAVMGYSPKEVDEFLDLITVDYNELMNDNKKNREKIEDLEERLRQSSEEIKSIKEKEDTVAETLNKAQNLMEGISSSAEKRADLILRNAESDAKRIREEAHNSVEKMTKESERLRANVEKFKKQYKDFLTGEIDKISDIDMDILSLLKPKENMSDTRTLPKVK